MVSRSLEVLATWRCSTQRTFEGSGLLRMNKPIKKAGWDQRFRTLLMSTSFFPLDLVRLYISVISVSISSIRSVRSALVTLLRSLFSRLVTIRFLPSKLNPSRFRRSPSSHNSDTSSRFSRCLLRFLVADSSRSVRVGRCSSAFTRPCGGKPNAHQSC
jgi:hypothetical protein